MRNAKCRRDNRQGRQDRQGRERPMTKNQMTNDQAPMTEKPWHEYDGLWERAAGNVVARKPEV